MIAVVSQAVIPSPGRPRREKCTLRPFKTIAEAKDVALKLYDQYGVLVEAFPCTGCGIFHLRFVRNLFKMRGIPAKENIRILTMFALGLRGPEIARDLQLNENVVCKRMQEMCNRSGAISREQLLAVSIWTGVINIV